MGEATPTALALVALRSALDGACSRVDVRLSRGGLVRVFDDGRLPPLAKLPALLTTLYACRCVRDDCGHRQGHDLVILNALSSRMEVEVWRSGKQWRQRARRGELLGRVERLPRPSRLPRGIPSGVRVTLRPDTSILGQHPVDALLLAQHLHDAAIYLPGLRASLSDARTGQRHTFHLPK